MTSFLFDKAKIDLDLASLNLNSGVFYLHLVVTQPLISSTSVADLQLPSLNNYNPKILTGLIFNSDKWSFNDVNFPPDIYSENIVGFVICKQTGFNIASTDPVICFSSSSVSLESGNYSLTEKFSTYGVLSFNTDPLFADVVLLLPLTTASGLTDVKGKSVNNVGSAASTVINDPFGNNTGVRAFTGGGVKITVAQSADFAFGAGAFAFDGWLYPTLIPAVNWGIADTRLAPNTALDWSIAGNPSGQISMYDTSTPFYEFNPPGLILNQWNYFCFSRPITSNVRTKLWINGNLATTNATRNNSITAGGNLSIGNTIDAISAGIDSFTGYMSNIRITRAYRDGSTVPTKRFATS